jgi:hypothetical protein
MKKIRLAFVLSLLFSNLIFAQSKKDIKKNKIKSITEWNTKFQNGKEVSFKESFTVFDKNGRTIELTEYTKDGSIKKKESTKYDAYDNKVEENKYENDQNSNSSKEKTKKIIYKYNINNDKIEEEEYDGNGKLLKKSIYSYDNKGLKVGKKTYVGDNVLETNRKYVYAY